MQSWFSGIAAAQISEGGEKCKAGFDGDVTINRTLFKQGQYGPTVILECTVTTSNHPEMPVGCQIGITNNLNNRNVAFSKLKGITAAALNLDKSNPQHEQFLNGPMVEQFWNNAVANETTNDLIGKSFHLKGTSAVSQQGNPYVKTVASPATGQAGPPVMSQAPAPAQPQATPGQAPAPPWGQAPAPAQPQATPGQAPAPPWGQAPAPAPAQPQATPGQAPAPAWGKPPGQ